VDIRECLEAGERNQGAFLEAGERNQAELPPRASPPYRRPTGITIGFGAAGVVVAAFVAALVPAGAPAWRVVPFAGVVAAVGAFAADPAATLATAIIGYPVLNGFLVNRLGELSWHGRPDLERALALLGAGVLGLGVAGLRRLAPAPGSARRRAWRSARQRAGSRVHEDQRVGGQTWLT
jgi:MFS family permease